MFLRKITTRYVSCQFREVFPSSSLTPAMTDPRGDLDDRVAAVDSELIPWPERFVQLCTFNGYEGKGGHHKQLDPGCETLDEAIQVHGLTLMKYSGE